MGSWATGRLGPAAGWWPSRDLLAWDGGFAAKLMAAAFVPGLRVRAAARNDSARARGWW